jgi:hypothetical protein
LSRIAVDFDGTLVEKAWPGMGDWLPGAVEAMKALHEAGHTIFLYSARLSGLWPDGAERKPAEVVIATQEVREKLDAAGLDFISIWTGEGKPHWDLLIDDKALYFPGRPGSWRKLVPVVLKRVGDEDSFDAVMAVAEEGDG